MISGGKNVNAITRTACLAVCGLLLSACSGSGSVNTGSGQSPDPATVDFPIFYVKRTIPLDTDDTTQLRDAVPSASLFKRDRASPSAAETNITERVTGTDLYDIKDLNVSYDGTKLVFAMRGPLEENMDEEDPPTWAIWEYDIAADDLHRVIASDTIADEGNDVAPAYLPDGRIVFSSTRQRQSKAILLDESKPQFEAQNEDRNEPAFVLHVMNANGSGIRQISFNQSSDLSPSVLSGGDFNGRVMWSRWDHAPGKNGIHLYTANPDGSDVQLLYGANSHDTGTNEEPIDFLKAREMQSGSVLALIRERSDVDFGGDLVMIDVATYVENHQPTLASAGMSGPAQTRATPNEVRTVPGPSPGGRFSSAFPLWDGTNRILATWSQCRVMDNTTDPATIVACTEDRLEDPDVEPAAVLYSVWIYDPAENTLQPIMQPEEGVMYSDVVAAQPRATSPGVILDRTPGVDFDANLVAENVGILDIKSVYDFDGNDTATPSLAAVANPATTPASQRPARFIRIEKAVSQPDDDVRDIDNAAFGASDFMREILAYAPVEPDGSVKIKVPADVAFQISVLDANGRRISPVHSSWLQVQVGETLVCNGCHTPATQANPWSHGRKGLYAALNAGAAAASPSFPGANGTFPPNAGETMAETRARVSCADDTPRCAAMTPSVNVQFTDVWSATPEADFRYAYNDPTFTTPAPTSDGCKTAWASTCRIVINYPQHVQPLWDRDRFVDANGDNVPDVDGNGVVINNKCTTCHGPVDAAAAPQVPAGQLDLTSVLSDEAPLRMRSYQELLFPDNEQEVNMGALQDRLVPGPPDEDGNPTQLTVGVGPYLNAGSARGALSNRSLSRFAAGSGDLHAGLLSPAELRLVSEWLDIGAQYFNNPFDPAVPVN